ncbi:MAG: hypothetical protein KBG80_03800 [Breznakibacter sp.]|nr:hypothetical protein [Breznakibacter sp.]
MIYENEAAMLLLGVGGLWFILRHYSQIKRIVAWPWFVASFYFLFLAWSSTILEGFWMPNLLNVVEHLAYATSAGLLFVWCWKLVTSSKQLK